MHQVIEHVDLLIVRRGEKVTVDIPVHVVGESASGTIHVVETQSLSLEADATALPDRVEVSIEGLEDGAIVHAGDITLPAGATLLTEPEHIVLTVSVPRASAEDLAAEEAAAEPRRRAVGTLGRRRRGLTDRYRVTRPAPARCRARPMSGPAMSGPTTAARRRLTW